MRNLPCRKFVPVRPLARGLSLAIAAAGFALVAGCGGDKPDKKEKPKITSRYQALPAKEVPAYLKNTVIANVDVAGTEPGRISGFGVVVNLLGTGDSVASTPVREYVIRQMTKRGVGSKLVPGFENTSPEEVLRDPRVAIVRVDGLIPPGARAGQRFDVQVTALEGNNTSSLSHGELWRTDLTNDGANPRNPGMQINILGICEGPVFVNPAFALRRDPNDVEAKASLRAGLVLGGGSAQKDRPLVLRLRQPQLSVSRAIEARIDEYFQDRSVAAAQDEGLINLIVPKRFNGDWEHFLGLALHLYDNNSPEYALSKSRELAEAAVQPEAKLLNISYAWEALGQQAIPGFAALMTSNKPDVAYAAARAGAWLGDPSAVEALIGIAKTDNHPFQIVAVDTLGNLPHSPSIASQMRGLLLSPNLLVRVEAYRKLAEMGDGQVISRTINERFILDIVPVDAPPVVFATRSGIPRVAIIGNRPSLNLPVIFMAMNGTLSISSQENEKAVTVYYRGADVPKPVRMRCPADLAQFVSLMGGEGPDGEHGMNFAYADIVAMLQGLSDGQKLGGTLGGKQVTATFLLEDSTALQNAIYGAPAIEDPQGRPQGVPQTVDPAPQAAIDQKPVTAKP